MFLACAFLLGSQAFAGSVEVSLAAGNTADALPVYPHATPRPDFAADESRMKSVSIDGPLHGSLTAATYVSKDSVEKILGFYRSTLKSYGEVVECAGGTNPDVNVRINIRNLDDPTCNRADIGSGATELRVGDKNEQRIVAVRATSNGSEFTLVSVVRRSKRPDFF
jgi:hypothetical protein